MRPCAIRHTNSDAGIYDTSLEDAKKRVVEVARLSEQVVARLCDLDELGRSGRSLLPFLRRTAATRRRARLNAHFPGRVLVEFDDRQRQVVPDVGTMDLAGR